MASHGIRIIRVTAIKGDDMKKRLIQLFSAVSLLMLTSCAAASAETLLDEAVSRHGECTLVSTEKADGKTEIVVHDTLQDFDYTLTGFVYDVKYGDITIGKKSAISDSFGISQREKILSGIKDGLDEICSADSVGYEIINSSLYIRAENEEAGKAAAVKCAQLIKKNDPGDRLDSMVINVYGDTAEEYYDDEFFGILRLPDETWMTNEEVLVEEFTAEAQVMTGTNAKYLRTEHGKFSDTGADLQRVAGASAEKITSPDSPVSYYYFADTDGTEFYICDFTYYDEDRSGFAWYTNYSGKKGG